MRQSCPPTASAACAPPGFRSAPRTRPTRPTSAPRIRPCSWTRTRSSLVLSRGWTRSRATTRTSRREIVQGRDRCDLALPPLSDGRALLERARAGEWVVDLRERHAFAARHLVGTLAFELSDPLTTYLGWLLPWGSPLSLIARSVEPTCCRSARAGTHRHRGDRSGRHQRILRRATDPWAGLATGSYPVVGFRRSQAVRRRPRRDRRWTFASAGSGARDTLPAPVHPAPRIPRPAG